MLRKPVICSLLFIFSVLCRSEPWVSTEQFWLRADLELLSSRGVIKVPINTWPLMWAPILRDLESQNFEHIDSDIRKIFLRVKRYGQLEVKPNKARKEIHLSKSQESQLLRHFGDKARNKTEIGIKTSKVSQNVAWNVDLTFSPDAVDGDEKSYDGSYFAGVIGNWVISVGQVEKWWGPSWQNSLIFSNNAKPFPAVSVQRNYSEPFENIFLSWMGPWTLHTFAGLLDDKRAVHKTKLFGFSLGFKPTDSLEVSLRRTAQWGGEGRAENFNSFWNMIIGLDNCDEGNLSCDNQRNEPGNQLAAIDFQWNASAFIPFTFYSQMVGEDEAGYFPSKKSFLYGLNTHQIFAGNPFFFNFEYLVTKVDGDGNEVGDGFTGYNVLYEHSLYQTGYRYQGRSLGATIDNDSKFVGATLIYPTSELGKFSYQHALIELNSDGENNGPPGGHSLVDNTQTYTEQVIKWEYETEQLGDFNISLVSRNKDVITRSLVHKKSSFTFGWTYKF